MGIFDKLFGKGKKGEHPDSGNLKVVGKVKKYCKACKKKVILTEWEDGKLTCEMTHPPEDKCSQRCIYSVPAQIGIKMGLESVGIILPPEEMTRKIIDEAKKSGFLDYTSEL